ncbi:MAG TPA: 50S ribosomal protein L29 [Candidatus Limnocylindrales bacterium]|nr:50S ribosomal protein L29 [Candidatus Limnocylindrales bacterium]
MKLNIKKELHTKSLAELRAQLKVAKEEKRVLNLDHEMGKLKNTSAVNQKRVEIAVISTIIKEKTTEAEALAAKALVSEIKEKGGKK